MFLIPISTMQMTTYIQTQTLLMYRPTIENLKQKFKAVKERKQICGVASCHAWVASQEAHLFNVVCPTLHFVLRRGTLSFDTLHLIFFHFTYILHKKKFIMLTVDTE